MDSTKRSTPRLITPILIAFVAGALLAPLGAKAAGSLVTIADPTTTSKARVVGGQLLIGDGQGPLTVNGVVGSRPDLAGRPVQAFASYFAGSGKVSTLVGRQAPNDRIAVTSITLTNIGGAVSHIEVTQVEPSGTGCPGQAYALLGKLTSAVVPVSQMVHLTFPYPLIETNKSRNKAWCIIVQGENGTQSDTSVQLIGYRI